MAGCALLCFLDCCSGYLPSHLLDDKLVRVPVEAEPNQVHIRCTLQKTTRVHHLSPRD
uniref:Uncharacterized protein n=1 Tax=Setaria viridis TaxID=4556 RepID=A0A4U6W0Z6_SETVI|nr:hypothetical protein SEVIR_2G357850v2 [Setaria viridis]